MQKGWPTASDEGAERRRARSFEDEAHRCLAGAKAPRVVQLRQDLDRILRLLIFVLCRANPLDNDSVEMLVLSR